MTRALGLLAAAALVAGCGGGSNVPPTIREQVRADLRCDPQGATMASATPGEQVWSVDACGRALTLRCPVEGGSLGRCAYGPAPTAGGAAATTPAAAPAPTPAAAPPPATYGGDPDGPIRVAIDQRAGAVLACTEGAVTAVDVSWTIHGSIAVELIGALSGTPAEACAAEALADLPLPGGVAGHVRHPVRRR